MAGLQWQPVSHAACIAETLRQLPSRTTALASGLRHPGREQASALRDNATSSLRRHPRRARVSSQACKRSEEAHFPHGTL